MLISTCLLFVFGAAAQQKKLVTDKETLFTKEEINRIDSMLQAYRQSSGNLVAVCTDSLDVTTNAYRDSLVSEYTKDDVQKPYAVFLLLSRKNGTVQLVSNELGKDIPYSVDDFIKIINYGVPALKEKKREEAVTIICKKIMELLDALPKKTNN